MLTPLAQGEANRLRDYFSQCNYTTEGLREVLVVNELASRQLRNLPRLLDRTGEGTPLHVLMRWFCFGVPVEAGAAAGAIPDRIIQPLLDCGLLTVQGTALASDTMLSPFEDLLVATDHSLKIEAGGDPEAVLVINPTTWLLHRYSVRRPCRAMLDLGAGCGAIGLSASSYSERVVATDLNPRATLFAAFNASLNCRTNVECLSGNAFEPVAGRKFDLILTNPPFFITPSPRYLFCENELELDLFCRGLVKQAHKYLHEDGILQMVCEWVEIQGQGWRERIAEWLEDSGCDAWVIKGHTEDPSRYAQARIRETTLGTPESDSSAYAEWMSYYRKHRVEAIHRGLIALRLRTGSNWVRIDEIPATPKAPFGNSILKGFAARDFLKRNSREDTLLTAVLKVSGDVRMERTWEFSGQRWKLDKLHLWLSTGMPNAQKLEPVVAEMIGALDGERTLGEAIDLTVSKTAGRQDEMREQLMAIARRLIESGVVEWV
ncbi:MAG: methyltransferase [Acidobacteriia bacterium]|nr:methyltransferase [Terriglobia bacterium]